MALAAQRGRRNHPGRVRIEHTDIGWCAQRKRSSCAAGNPRRLGGDPRERGGQRHAATLGPGQGERQQQLQTGHTGLRLTEWQQLRVIVDRGVIRADRIDRAVGHRLRQRFAIALRTKRRHHPIRGIEIADIHIDQMQVMNRHISAHRQALAPCRAHQLDPGSR